MKDENKTKAQLINELAELRQRIAELEASEAERKRAEEEIKAKSQFLESLIEQSPLPTFVIDSEGICVMVNKAFLKAYNVPKKEMVLGRNALTEPANVRQGVVRYIKEALSGKIVETPEIEFISPYENKRTVTKSRLFPIFDATNKLTNVVVVHEDITARKRAEEALRDSEERLRTIFAASPDFTYLTDAEGSILYANPALLELVGLSLEQMRKKNVLDFFAGDNPEKLLQAAARLQAGEEVRGLETQVRIATGEMRDYEIHAIPLREKETVTAILSVARDITERKQAEEALRRSLEETARGHLLLLALSQAAQAVERARTPEEVYCTVGDEIARLGYHALVLTLTDDRAHLTISHTTFEPASLRAAERLAGRPAQGYRFPLVPDGFFQRIIAEGEATFVEQAAEPVAETLPKPLRPLAGRLVSLLGLEQGIVALLTVGGETHGLLVVTGAGLTEADAPAVTAFANQAAIAIENARLYEAEAQRRQEAETLRQAAAVLTSTLDFEQVLDHILEQVGRVVPNDATNIMLVKGDQAHIVRWRGYERFGGEKFASTTVFRIPEVPNLQQVLESGEPMVIPDTATYPGWVHVPVREWPRSHAAAPIIVRGEVIGFLNVNSAIPGFFAQAHVGLLRAFANQAAIAIENARLYQAERKRATQLAVVNQVARRAASILDVDQLLPEVVAAIQQSFDYYHVGLFLLDEVAGELEMRAIAGGFADIAPPDRRLALGEGMAGWTAETGQSLLANDVSREPRYVLGILKQALTKAELCVPLKLAGKVIGVLDIQCTRLNAFDETDLMAMETLADQLAVAIENAQLYQETVRRLKETETLGVVTTALTRSLDLDQVLQSIVDSATRLISASTSGVIHLIDEATGKLIPLATSVPETNTQEKLEMPIGEGIAGLVMQEKRLINVPNVEEDPRFLPMDTASPNKSLVTVPLLIDKDCIGTLSLNSDQVGAFSADDEWLLTTLAAQAAVAVRNARLLEQALQDAETKATLLQEVNHRVKNNLSAIVGLLYAERRHAAIKDQAVYQSIIQNMSNRVQGLATVHSLLSASEWAPLSLSGLAAQVVRSSLQILPRDKSVFIDVTPSPVRVTPDQAHDLAMVINELATNTVRHVLEERDTAHITVRIGLDDDTVLFEFRDDGPGYPEEVLQLERHNVGFYLIQRIVLRTLRGELSLHNDKGAVAVIQFKAQA